MARWSQGAGKIPVDPTGFPAVFWKQLLSQFPQVNRKVKLALPCIGMDALGHGLQEMEWDSTEIVYAYDTDGALLPALLHLHGPEQMSKFNIGSEHGDLLQIDVTSWSRVDFVISGPPCPPFSSIGNRKDGDDARELVFQQVTKIIIHQGCLACWGFVVEMVPGIMEHRGGEPSYHERWLAHLRWAAPMFLIQTWPMQSMDYLPQNRLRIYTVGTLRALGQVPPPMIPSKHCRASLHELLHTGLPPITEELLTRQQQENLIKARQIACRRLQARAYVSPASGNASNPTTVRNICSRPACIVVMAVDRDPDKGFGEHLRIDSATPTLRAGHDMLWLWQLNKEGHVRLSRQLHPVERLAVQGFRPEVAKHFSKKALIRATGQ